jgi:hypothetical protein
MWLGIAAKFAANLVVGAFKTILDKFVPSTDRQLGRAETTAGDEKEVIDDIQKADTAAADPAAIDRVRREYSEP